MQNQNIFEAFTENNERVGNYLGITDPSEDEWSFAIYIGNSQILSLYDQRKGLNESAFDEISKIWNITKQSFMSNNWSWQNVRNLESLLDREYHIVCYKLNFFDLIREKKIGVRELILVLKHNLKQIHTLEVTDVVKFERGLYSHHAVLTNRGYMKVTHKSGDPNMPIRSAFSFRSLIGVNPDKACVGEAFLIEVAGHSKIHKANHLYDNFHKPKPKEEILKEAKKRLGERGYSLTRNNCQTFCSVVRNGKATSPELEDFKFGTYCSGVVLFAGYTAYAVFRTFFSRRESSKRVNFN